MKKGQVSVELLVVIGVILVFFIPLLLISYFKVIEINQELSSIQANVAVNRLANTIDSVGRMGEGSSIILDIYLPLDSKLEFKNYDPGSEVTLTTEKNSGTTHAVANTWFQIEYQQNNLPGGNYRFNITSEEGYVSVVLAN